MADWKEYIWILPIIGGIFAIISIITPVASFSFIGQNADLWLISYWDGGTYLGKGWVDEIRVNSYTAEIAASKLPFLLGFWGVLIGGIIALGVGGLGYRGNFRKGLALLSGILMIALTLLFIWWVEYDNDLFSYPTLTILVPYQEVELSGPDIGFGLIGPFIGGAFCLAGGLIPTKTRIE